MTTTMEEAPVRELHLKNGRDRSIRQRHPWVFTGAIAQAKGPATATIAHVFASSGEKLASGFFSAESQIAARLIAFGAEELTADLVRSRIAASVARRAPLFNDKTNALRIVNTEGDDLGGLVVDRYGDILVVEIGSAGLDQWRDLVLDALTETTGVRSIFLKNDIPTRKLEGLARVDEWRGEGIQQVIIRENGLRFQVAPQGAQKTGFFLDQRDNRALVGELAANRRVLNLFAYSGAFGVYAMRGGASSVEEVDISAPAIELAQENHRLNDSADKVRFTTADAFQYARTLQRDGSDFDFIVCDPPAFAKSRNEVDRAARGYKDINLQVFKLAAKGALVATFSCSGHVSLELFQKIIFAAALDAGRSVSFIKRLGAGSDHPVSIYCPESEYLKGFLVQVND